MANHEPEAIAFCQQTQVAWIASGKTMRECAKEVGCSHGIMSRIFGGKLPDLDTYFKMKRWLVVKGDALAQLRQLVTSAEESLAAG